MSTLFWDRMDRWEIVLKMEPCPFVLDMGDIYLSLGRSLFCFFGGLPGFFKVRENIF